MRDACIAILLLLFTPLAWASDAAECASTLQELRTLTGDPLFSPRWEEVSMDDGKPIVASIVERNGSLLLEFVKTGEGLWAEISGLLCKSGTGLEARVSKEQVYLTPSAHWVFRLALANGGVFRLRRNASSQWLIETSGWCGRFVSSAMN